MTFPNILLLFCIFFCPVLVKSAGRYKMSRFHKFGWSEISSGSDVDFATIKEDMKEPFFYISHKGVIVESNPQILQESKTHWARCLIGFLIDDRNFSPRHMQAVLHHVRRLKDEFQVIGKEGNFYMFQINNDDYRKYIHANGPWLV